MTRYLVVDGPNGWLNGRGCDTSEDDLAIHNTQLRWSINPKIIGLPLAPFRIARFEQSPPGLTGDALTRIKFEMANNDAWNELEVVGLPVPLDWHPRYHNELQGPFTFGINVVPPQLMPEKAALQRLVVGTPKRGWDSLQTISLPGTPTSSSEEATRWRAPDFESLVNDLVEGPLLASVHDMLGAAQNPQQQFDFLSQHVPGGIDDTPHIHLPELSLLGNPGDSPTPPVASWHPLGALLLAAAADPFTAIALGFGCGIDRPGSAATEMAYRISLDLGRTDASGEDLAIADIVWARFEPVKPNAVTGLKVYTVGIMFPPETDQPRLETVHVEWDRPPHPANSPEQFLNTPYPASYAIARLEFSDLDASILLEPRPRQDGWMPFIATRDPKGGPIVFADNLIGVSGIHHVDPGARVAKYGVVAQDIFGRWSDWTSVNYEGEAEKSQVPGLHQLTISAPGQLDIDFSWDWTARSPEFIEVHGEFVPAGDGPGFTARVNFGGANQPNLAGLNLVALNQELNPTNFGPNQDQPTTTGTRQPGARYYRLTTNIGPVSNKALRTFRVEARGLCHLHPHTDADIDVSAFGPPLETAVYSNLIPDAPQFDGQPTEAPLWASVRDAAGLSRFVVRWNTIPNATGYVVYEATETGLRAALGGGEVDTAESFVTRLDFIRQNLHDERHLFRRLNKELIKDTFLEVTLPRGSNVIHVFAVTAQTEIRKESNWTANGRNVLAVAIPHLDVPPPPILDASAALVGSVPGAKLCVGLATGVTAARIEIFRTTKPELATDVDRMGPPLSNINANGAMPELTDIGTDTDVKPGWGRVFYRAVCWSASDLKRGLVEARSLASPAVSVIVPPNTPPKITDLRVNEPGSSAAVALVSWATDAPSAITPYGSFQVIVAGRDVDAATLPPRRVRLDTLPLLASSASIPGGTPGEIQIALVGVADDFRLFARVPRSANQAVVRLTVGMIDPLGRVASAPADIPNPALTELPRLGEISLISLNPLPGTSELELRAGWRVLSSVFQPALDQYTFAVRRESIAPNPSEEFGLNLAQIIGTTGERIVQDPASGEFSTTIDTRAVRLRVRLTDPLGNSTEQSLNIETTRVPSIVGTNVTTARQLLATAGLGLVFDDEFDHADTESVLNANPAPGTRVLKGMLINVHAGTVDVEPVRVPDVMQLNHADARRRIINAGLIPDDIPADVAIPGSAIVIGQRPEADTAVDPGSHVELTFFFDPNDPGSLVP